MTDPKIALVNCIMLLVRERQLQVGGLDSKDFVLGVMESIKTPDTAMELDDNKNIIDSLKGTIGHIISQPEGTIIDVDILKQNVKITYSGSHIMEHILSSLDEEAKSEDRLRELIKLHRRGIKDFMSQTFVVEKMIKTQRQLTRTNSMRDVRKLIRTTMAELEPYTSIEDQEIITGEISSVMLDDADGLEEQLEEAKAASSDEGIMRTGYQGLNELLDGGVRRGEYLCIGALQHNYKSGLIQDILRGISQHNKPFMLDESKKPLILDISLENNLDQNVLRWYERLWVNKYKVMPDLQNITVKEAVKFIQDEVGKNGYMLGMHRFNGSDFSIAEFIELIERYEALGYEIHGIGLDYQNLMSKEGTTGNNESGMIRDLIRRTRNVTNPKKIALVTAHQLRDEAKQLIRNGAMNFVKLVANNGYWDSCRVVDQEIDAEVHIHIEKPNDNQAFLTFQRGKHRKTSLTPEKQKYFAMEFTELGLLDDVDGVKTYVRNISNSGNGADFDFGGSGW